MEKLIIDKPYIEKNRLYSNIKTEDIYKMWFEVEDEYIKYLCDERSDAFVIATLPYAIKHELDIEVKGKISSKLYYQLNNCLVPLLCNHFGKKFIKIEGVVDNTQLKTENGVGTGISCGIDSFYTILKNSNLKTSEFNVAYLTFFNAGASGKFGGEDSRKLYNKRKENSRKFAQENGFKFVCVDSNMNEFIMMSHLATHTFRSLACVLALQKLFSKYYYASGGEDFNETKITPESTAYYDILNVQCLSNENVQFYSDGIGISRLNKIKKIVNYPITYKWLNVCIGEEENCGHCSKCIRTLLELESIGQLNNYCNVFDLNDFKKNRSKFIGYMIEQKSSNVYFKEIYNEYKKNKIEIPIISYVIAFFYKLEKLIKKYLKIIIPKKTLNLIKRRKCEIIDEGW